MIIYTDQPASVSSNRLTIVVVFMLLSHVIVVAGVVLLSLLSRAAVISIEGAANV